MPALRHADPPRPVHEPVVVHLPALPAAPAPRPLVVTRRSANRGGQRRAASAATSGATVPSARAGVQASLRTHSDAQPTHRNSGSPSRSCPAGRQSQTSWQGWAASVVTAPVCRPAASLARRGRPADGVGARSRAGRRVPLVDPVDGARAGPGRLGRQPRRRPRRGGRRGTAGGAGAAAGGPGIRARAGPRGWCRAPLVRPAGWLPASWNGDLCAPARRVASLPLDRSGERRAAVLTVS